MVLTPVYLVPSTLVTSKLGTATMPLLISTFVPKAAANGVSCDTLTPSVLALPAPTFLITLPPLFKPSAVKLTVCLPVGAMVTPSLFTLVSPVVTLPVAPRLIFSASLIFKVFVALSATTAMLFSVKSPVAPPLIFKVVPSLRVTSAPVSPAKVKGLATSSFKAPNAPPTVLWVLPAMV